MRFADNLYMHKIHQKLMQKLANNGEGQFIQIRNPWEARTVLVDEIKLNSKR